MDTDLLSLDYIQEQRDALDKAIKDLEEVSRSDYFKKTFGSAHHFLVNTQIDAMNIQLSILNQRISIS